MQAFYGVPNLALVEVTNKLTPLLEKGRLVIDLPYNVLFGDPYYGQGKVLIIKYKEKRFTFPENSSINISLEELEEKVKLLSGEARFFSLGEEVTEKIKSFKGEIVYPQDLTLYNRWVGEIKIKERTPFTFSFLEPQLPKINVVYFINTICNSGDWTCLLRHHLNEFLSSGLLEAATLYIEVTTEEEERFREEVAKIAPQAIINSNKENTFEYWGIKRVWELGKAEPHSFIFYSHDKGATKMHYFPDPIYTGLASIIQDWKRWVYTLVSFPTLDKAGAPSEEGFAWFNFFWVKGSYVSRCEEPKLTKFRHYYEYWLASAKKSTLNFLNVYYHDIIDINGPKPFYNLGYFYNGQRFHCG